MKNKIIKKIIKNRKALFILGGIFWLSLVFCTQVQALANQRIFYVDKNYDFFGREKAEALLVKITNQIYFYADKVWWDKLTSEEKNKNEEVIYNLANEFERNIYPSLTQIFGKEDNPGIDKDPRLIVVLQLLKEDVGGYIRTEDGYPLKKAPFSNEGEIIYLNSHHLLLVDFERLSYHLAHEFFHLISFNQKTKTFGIEEETWLEEGRAEYLETLLGYNKKNFSKSALQNRIREFNNNPVVSWYRWQNRSADYASVNLFLHYLVDHYGLNILIDSLHSNKKGADSLNYALKKSGFAENFDQIFENWLIASVINDCRLDDRHCYKNPFLKNLAVFSYDYYYLPPQSESLLIITESINTFSANWKKIVGGKGVLKFEFERPKEGGVYRLPYVIVKKDDSKVVKVMDLSDVAIQTSQVPSFGEENVALIIIPYVLPLINDYNVSAVSYIYRWQIGTTVSRTDLKLEESSSPSPLASELQRQIDYLKKQIAFLQTQISANRQTTVSCSRFDRDLYFGMRNNSEVRCLQEFLKAQGPEIYPQSLVTGNFLFFTRQAIIRFQEKYAAEILAPLGLKKGTGYVGVATRMKINQLLK